MVADYHLILSSAFHDGDYSFHVFQHLVMGFALIFQLKTQPGDTVGKADYIFFSSHVPDNLFCQFFILSHCLFLHNKN